MTLTVNGLVKKLIKNFSWNSVRFGAKAVYLNKIKIKMNL